MNFATMATSRRGAAHACYAPTRPRAAPCFDVARAALHAELSALVFARVVGLTESPASHGRPPHFYGEVVEVACSSVTTLRYPRRMFFDKQSRARGLRVGGALLADAPLGLDHFSSTPQMGDLLVGTAQASSRASARCSLVLTQWSNNAKPLMELARLVAHGTRCSESEAAGLLCQPASALAEQFLRSPSSTALSLLARRAVEAAAAARDDIALLARIVLWGNVRLLAVVAAACTGAGAGGAELLVPPTPIEAAATVRTSLPPQQLVETVGAKLGDPSILGAYWAEFAAPPPPVHMPPPVHRLLAAAVGGYSYAPPSYVPTSPPLYAPTSPPLSTPRSPTYTAHSPLYPPTSHATLTSPPRSPPCSPPLGAVLYDPTTFTTS